MSIEIRQLSIKTSVLQQNSGEGGGTATSSHATPSAGTAYAGTQLDEDIRNDILAECRAMVLDLLSRSRER